MHGWQVCAEFVLVKLGLAFFVIQQWFLYHLKHIKFRWIKHVDMPQQYRLLSW